MKPILLICKISYSRAFDGVQPKTSPFSPHHLIWVNYKVVSQLSALIFVSFSYLNSSQTKFSHWIVSSAKNISTFSRLFSILTYIFFAIELLDFSIIQNSIFITQESSRYLGFKKRTPYVKWIDIFCFFVYIKTPGEKKQLYISVDNNYSHQRKTTRACIYKQKAKNVKPLYIIKKKHIFPK